MDWPNAIAGFEAMQRRIHAASPASELPFVGRRPPADPSALERFTSRSGLELDSMHREFLLCTDGWADCLGLELLSCAEISESSLLERGRAHLAMFSGGAMEKWRKKRNSMQIIGVSEASLTVLCMPIEGRKIGTEVVMFTAVEPTEWKDFETYFNALISYQPAALKMFQEQGGNRP